MGHLHVKISGCILGYDCGCPDIGIIIISKNFDCFTVMWNELLNCTYYSQQNGSQIEDLYDLYWSSSNLSVQRSSFYQQCYDATWILGWALKLTLESKYG